MPFDPAAGFPLTAEAALRARVAELERRLGANPGAQAGGGAVADVLAVPYAGLTVPQIIAQNGPKATFTVPEGGGLVQIYGEAELRLASIQGGLPATNWLWGEIFVVDDVWLGGDTTNGIFSNTGHMASQVSLGAPNPSGGAFNRVRTPGQRVSDVHSNYGLAGIDAGVLAVAWAKGGQRTFYLAAAMNGDGVTSNAGTVWEFKNRRLMARVVQ